MARIETKYLNLVLPDEHDKYNIQEFNSNFQKIDNAMELLKNGNEDLNKLSTADKTSLVNAINEVFQRGGDVKAMFVDALKAADVWMQDVTTDETFEQLCEHIGEIVEYIHSDYEEYKRLIIDALNNVSDGTTTIKRSTDIDKIPEYILQYGKTSKYISSYKKS